MEHRKILPLDVELEALGFVTQAQAGSAKAAASSEGELTEGRIRMVTSKSGKLVRTRTERSTPSERRAWKLAKKKSAAKRAVRKHAASGAGKRHARLRKKAESRYAKAHGKPLHQGNDRVSNLLEEVQGLVRQVGEARPVHRATPVMERDEAVGYAEVALNCDLLGRAFAVYGSVLSDPELTGLAEDFATMADEAATAAETLAEGGHPEGDLAARFNALALAVADGVDLFDAIQEELVLEAEEETGAEKNGQAGEKPAPSSSRRGGATDAPRTRAAVGS